MNLFRFCSGLKVLGYFMILLVVAVVAVSYYAVVVTTWWPILIESSHRALSALALLIIVVFHFLLVMLLWSYLVTVFTDPGSVPEHFRRELVGENLEAGTSTDQGAFGSLGYCPKCRNVKPPRCHHCSVCQRCVLKMDHHCVWIVNCVGARNYKFFLLFLFYTFLETMLDVIVLLPSFIEFFSQAIKHSSSPGNLASLVLAFVLNLAFVLSLLCFVVMHISLLSTNTTSVEVHEKNGEVRWKYDLGKKKNFEQVFGKKKAFWLLPLYWKDDLDNMTSLHGLEFPTRSDMDP